VIIGVLLALLGATAFSVMNVAVRKGVRPGDADNGVLTSVVVNVLLFTGVVGILAALDGPPRLSAAGIIAFLCAGFCSTFLGRLTLFGGIRRIGAVRATAIKNGTPLVALILAVTVLGEQVTPLGWLGIGLILLGIALVVRESMERSQRTDLGTDRVHPATEALQAEALAEGGEVEGLEAVPRRPTALARRAMLLGVGLALVAAVSFGLGQMLRKVGMDILPDAAIGAAVGSWSALITSTLVALVRGELGLGLARVRRWRPYFWLAGIGGGIGQLSSFAALQYAPLAHVSVVAGSETILTVLFSGLLVRRSEHITRALVIPAALVSLGVVMIALSR
jgi:drug/metabolite transporter (DMT)-like permease